MGGQRSTRFHLPRRAVAETGHTPQPTHVQGPLAALHPTQARFQQYSSQDIDHLAHAVDYQWTSRNNRKGRHALVLSSSAIESPSIETPARTSKLREVLRGLSRMATRYPYWDISWLVAVIFTFGSVVWVINSFFAFLPLVDPGTAFENESLYGGGITAFIGATIFEIGSVLLMLEAINENKTACFGWAIEKAIDDHEGRSSIAHAGEKGEKLRVHPDWDACHHHHKNKNNLVGKPGQVSTTKALPASQSSSVSSRHEANEMNPNGNASVADGGKSWQWYPSLQALRTHYLYDLGFLACSSQMAGATIFWIAGYTALPGIYNKLSLGLADGVYWTPQVVGGCGFIISGTLFMIETQKAWWRPAFGTLGWHIGAWNLVGGIGFTLSAVFGYWAQAQKSWGIYQASLSTFWGSWAFLVGSAIQWYESLDKHPVEKRS